MSSTAAPIPQVQEAPIPPAEDNNDSGLVDPPQAEQHKHDNGLIDGKRRSHRLRGVKTAQVEFLQLEEDSPLMRRKRQRKVKSTFKIPFDDLCGGIIQVIYSMLKDPRDVYNLSQCDQRIRSLVTYEHVVRAAVSHGNQRTTRTITRIVNLVHLQYIFVPSVYRLLRLVNGKSCERGK